VLLLAGHAWLVTYVDWKRHRCFVEPTDLPGRARWSSSGGGLSFNLTRGMRDVVLGADLGGVSQTRRAIAALAEVRDRQKSHVALGRTVLERTAPHRDRRTGRGSLGSARDPPENPVMDHTEGTLRPFRSGIIDKVESYVS
jgi:hypothetical protein